MRSNVAKLFRPKATRTKDRLSIVRGSINGKRTMDLVFATAMLFLLAPILMLIFIAIKLDSGFGEASLNGALASSVFWVIVAVAVALTLTLLNALRGIHSRIRRPEP